MVIHSSLFGAAFASISAKRMSSPSMEIPANVFKFLVAHRGKLKMLLFSTCNLFLFRLVSFNALLEVKMTWNGAQERKGPGTRVGEQRLKRAVIQYADIKFNELIGQVKIRPNKPKEEEKEVLEIIKVIFIGY